MITLDFNPHVWGITGNLGGGKSLTAVSIAVSAIRQGYFVVSNISLKTDVISKSFGVNASMLYKHFSFEDKDFDPFQLPVGSPRGTANPKRVVVILDECAEWIDQYSSAKDFKIQRFWSWIRHSNKRNQDVILVIQRLDYLNKVLRLLVSKWVICDDLKVWRMPLLKVRLPFCSDFCMQRVFDRNKRIVQGPLMVRKSYFGKFYDTSECLNTDGAKYNNGFRSVLGLPSSIPYIVAWILSVFLMVFVMSFSSSHYCVHEFQRNIMDWIRYVSK